MYFLPPPREDEFPFYFAKSRQNLKKVRDCPILLSRFPMCIVEAFPFFKKKLLRLLSVEAFPLFF